MAVGRMNKKAKIIQVIHVKDEEGFTSEVERLIAEIRCEKEGRHGSERWANLAVFSEATDIFRFRVIPGVKITEEMFIVYEDRYFNILSVEDIKGRNMYLEVQAKEVKSSDGKM